MSRRRTVVELTEVRVEPALVDGAHAPSTRRGIFTSFATASAWLHSRVRDDRDDDDLLYFTAQEVLLDRPRRVCNSVVYDRNGNLRGEVSRGIERPWGGREPSACAYKPGDVVGLVSDAYRVGVVLALPPSPDEARRWSDVTLGDALYLVGVLDRNGSPETNEHVTEPELFEVQHEVPAELRTALAKRFAGYAR